MHETHRRSLATLLLIALVQVATPAKFLHSVPLITDACVQGCTGEEQACSVRLGGAERPCHDEMRICVHRCDPQLMNATLLEELDRLRQQRYGAVYRTADSPTTPPAPPLPPR